MAGYGLHHAEIALCVFKIYGIDFVRHGRRTHFAGCDFLPEILHGDVRPYIAAEVCEDGGQAHEPVHLSGEVVVRLDLGRGKAALQSEALFNKAFGESLPIYIRIGDVMRVEVADSPSEFSAMGNVFEEPPLPF